MLIATTTRRGPWPVAAPSSVRLPTSRPTGTPNTRKPHTRKLITAGMAVAMLSAVALPSVASADVQRHQEQTGTITVTLPQYKLVHTFTGVTVNPCDGGSFTGISGTRNVGGVVEEVSGSIKNGVVQFSAVYTESNYTPEIGYTWHTTT